MEVGRVNVEQDLIMLDDELKRDIEKIRTLVRLCEGTIRPVGPYESIFFLYPLAGPAKDPVVAYFELKRLVVKVSRFISLDRLSSYLESTIVEQEDLDIVVEVVVESIPELVKRDTEVAILDSFANDMMIEPQRLINTWDVMASVGEVPQLDEVADVIRADFPVRIRWTDQVKTFNWCLQNYKRKIRTLMNRSAIENKNSLFVAVDSLKEAKSVVDFTDYYRVHDMIRSAFASVVDMKLRQLVLAIQTVKVDYVASKFTMGMQFVHDSCYMLSPYARVRMHRDFYASLKVRYKGSNFFSDLFDLVVPLLRKMSSNTNFASVPRRVYNYLRDGFNFTGEMFANALNVTLMNYYSDNLRDKLFGSLGNVFEMSNVRGRWVANPPYSRQIIGRFLTSLEGCVLLPPFSIILILPVAYSDKDKSIRQRIMGMPLFAKSRVIDGHVCFDQYVRQVPDEYIIGSSSRLHIKPQIELFLISNETEQLLDVLAQMAAIWMEVVNEGVSY